MSSPKTTTTNKPKDQNPLAPPSSAPRNTFEHNISIDIRTPRLLPTQPKPKPPLVTKDFFDDYLRRLDEEKHKAMLSREMEEMRRVDASLLSMMKKLDGQRVGSIDYLALEEDFDGAEPQHRLRMFLQQQEYEKKLLVSQLEMREEQLKQLLEVMKGNGKLDKQLVSDISSGSVQPGDSPAAELPRIRSELEQLRRLHNKQTMELQAKDSKLELQTKELIDRTKQMEKLQIELETSKRSRTDNSSESDSLRRDLERLKDEARRAVSDKEKATNELEIVKRSIVAKSQEWEKEKQRIDLEHSTKLAAAQGNQAASGRVREMETENLKAEVDRMKRQLEKANSDAAVQDSNNKKLIASLETEIVKMKQDLAASKDSIKTIEALKKREQELQREIEGLRQVSRPGSNTQQVDRLQKELMDANAISQQQAMMIAQLKAELASAGKGGSTGSAPGGPASGSGANAQQLDKANKEIADLKTEVNKLNTQLADAKKNGGNSAPGSNTQAVDKMNKEVSELKTDNMKLSGQVTILTKKNEELEEKLKGLSAGGDSATKALEEEIKRLKEQLDLEEKKKQSLIVRFNEKIAERDEDIKQLKAASSGRGAEIGGGPGDASSIKKAAQLEAEVNRLRSELQKAQLSREEIKILESTQGVDPKVAQLKEVLKKKNEAITFRMEETNQKTLKIAELEAKLTQSMNGNVDVKEINELREENEAIQQKFQEQIGLLAELTDKVEDYAALLRKNKIPFKS